MFEIERKAVFKDVWIVADEFLAVKKGKQPPRLLLWSLPRVKQSSDNCLIWLRTVSSTASGTCQY